MKKQTTKTVQICCILLLFMLSHITGTTFAFENDVNTTSLINLETKIDSLIKKFSIPGACTAIVSKDSMNWIECFGVANLETRKPLTENTLFRVASISKSFIGLAFLKLAEEGKVDLNRPVRELIPEIEIDNPYKDTNPVRIVHLLEHTAGFDAAHFYEYYNLNDDPEIPLKEVLSINPNSRKIRWKPGTRIAYTNHGYAVAGYILEKITGQLFEDYLKNNILDPIGMTSSTFKPVDKRQVPLAQGYTENSQPFPDKPFYLRPASSLKSSVKDMAKFVQFMLNQGKVENRAILSEKSIGRMEVTETTTVSPQGFKAGYGLGVKTYYRNGYKCFVFTGGIPGFTSIYAYIKDVGLGCVVLVNSSNVEGFFKIYDLVFQYVVRNSKPAIKPSIQLTTSQLQKYSGYYAYRNPDEQLSAMMYVLFSGTTVSCEKDTLYIKDFMSEKKALIPVSANTFRRSNEPDASIIFTEADNGRLIMSDMSYYYEKTGSWKPILSRTLLISAIIIMFSQFIFAMYWIPVYFYRKLKHKENRLKYIIIRVMPLLAVLSLLFGVISIRPGSASAILDFGQISFASVSFYIFSLLFAGFSILTLLFSIISFKKPIKMPVRIYFLLVSIACFGMTAYLFYWGIIGLKLWAY